MKSQIQRIISNFYVQIITPVQLYQEVLLDAIYKNYNAFQ